MADSNLNRRLYLYGLGAIVVGLILVWLGPPSVSRSRRDPRYGQEQTHWTEFVGWSVAGFGATALLVCGLRNGVAAHDRRLVKSTSLHVNNLSNQQLQRINIRL
jgi:hypothetical protein